MCEIFRSSKCESQNKHFRRKVSRKVDNSGTFGDHFPKFEDIDLCPEAKFLGSLRGFERYINYADVNSLKRDTFFEYATSSPIPTFRESL